MAVRSQTHILELQSGLFINSTRHVIYAFFKYVSRNWNHPLAAMTLAISPAIIRLNVFSVVDYAFLRSFAPLRSIHTLTSVPTPKDSANMKYCCEKYARYLCRTHRLYIWKASRFLHIYFGLNGVFVVALFDDYLVYTRSQAHSVGTNFYFPSRSCVSAHFVPTNKHI